jgi:hypothetical protein
MYIAEEDSEKPVQTRDFHSAAKVTLTSLLMVLSEIGNAEIRHSSFSGYDATKAPQLRYLTL